MRVSPGFGLFGINRSHVADAKLSKPLSKHLGQDDGYILEIRDNPAELDRVDFDITPAVQAENRYYRIFGVGIAPEQMEKVFERAMALFQRRLVEAKQAVETLKKAG